MVSGLTIFRRPMIKPVIKKVKLDKETDDRETIAYWLSKTPEERMDAMGELYLQQLIIQGYDEIPGIKKIVKKVKTVS